MRSLRGFALPSAIFLLVVLALLGAFMVSLSTSQSMTSAQDVQGAKAYRAARAGIERALFSLQPPATTCGAVPASLTIDGFSVVIGCTAATHDEDGVSKYIFRVTATATAGGSIGNIAYVERSVNSLVEF